MNVAVEREATISRTAIQKSLKKEVSMEDSQVTYRVTRTSRRLYLVFLSVLRRVYKELPRKKMFLSYFARLKTSADIGLRPESSARMMEVMRMPRLRQEITETGTRLREEEGEARLIEHTEDCAVMCSYTKGSARPV